MRDNVKFSVLVSLFNWISKSKSSSQKRTKFRKFIDHFCNPIDYFPSMRLILPSLDRERGSYGLKESVLALSLLDALGIARDSQDAKNLVNWRKSDAVKFAGNFSLVAADVLQRRQSSVSGDLTVRQVNEILDRLASVESRREKSEVLGELIRKTNSNEMKWIIMIILKDLKLGISEKSIFHEFHPDAEDLFNVTCDLRLVCEKLSDRKVRHRRQDIEVGKAVRPQLATRVASCGNAWKKMNGKDVVVECKFDGDRIQIHKNGDEVRFFSRNFIEHSEYVYGMCNVIVENVNVDKCILDGEMLVWDKSSNRFAEFGSNQEIAKAAREGLGGDRELCYVAFDVLYVGDSSVIHQSLKERHELLRKFVKPVKGRLEILLPNGGGGGGGRGDDDNMNAHRHSGEPSWSIVANHVDEVERFFKETVENRGEGIVIKDLGSKWEPGDRSGKWLKVKPDYVKAGADLDVLIIGGYYGSGRRGGEVGQFLVGLAERTAPGSYPRRFVSFCRVGTGLTGEELNELVTKLKPYFRKYQYPKKSPPSFYHTTNHSKERPDVWVESPEKSVIVSITSDIRTVSSEVFAAPYGLRFPRIDRVRYDKPWHECLDVPTFLELVHSSNGTTQRRGGAENEELPVDKPKRSKTTKKDGSKRLAPTVASHFTRTDVSSVKGESQIFSNMVFHFVNVPSDHSLDSMHKLVAENGGTFSMNLNDTVTHCIGADSRGIKYEAVKRRGRDVIHYSWVLDCCSQKQLLPLRPKHFIFLSDPSKKKLQEEIDEFSDSYFCDLNVDELKQIFSNVSISEDTKLVEYYKKKYCPCEEWGRFHGCSVYFHLVPMSRFADWDVFLEISMRRMKVEVSLGGGEVSDNPSKATHLVVMSVPGHELKFDSLLESFPEDQKHLLSRKRINVVGSQWLEDSLKEKKKMPEVAYNLKPTTLEETVSEEEKDENNDLEKHAPSPAHEEKPRIPVSKTIPLIREPKRKRGRPSETSTRKGKTVINKPPRTKRARVGRRPAKLQEMAFDSETSEHETDAQAKASPEREMHDHDFQDAVYSDERSEHETNKLAKTGFEIENIGLGPRSQVFERKEDTEANMNKPETDETRSNCLGDSSSVSFSKRDKDTAHSEKLEVMIDPSHKMLLDMFPRLQGTSWAKNAVVGDKSLSSKLSEEGSSVVPPKSEPVNENLSSTQSKEKSSLEQPGVPVKKKKVSYRELAMKLLND